jgi:L-ribulose-5-phosphate 3-epimerase
MRRVTFVAETITRREFVKSGSAALVLSASGSLAVASNPRNIKKAIMYGTIGYPGPVLDKFRAVRAAGFEGVEPMSHMNREEVLKAFGETGLKAASVCCATHWQKTLSDPDEEVRREALEGLKHALKDAKAYGASSVLLVPGVVKGSVTYQDCFQRSVAQIRKAAPVAEDLGVKIAVENVWNNFITKPQQAVEFLDAIDSKYVGWHFDIGNCIRYSPSETWIPVIGKRILKLHIKEYSQFKKFDVRLLEGDDHWPPIMHALDEIGYQGWGISEQPTEQSRDRMALKDLSERMGRIFAI